MSNLYDGNDECEAEKNPCNGIDLVLKPGVKDLGSFSVRRALPSAQQRKVGPWIFFDHAGPAHFAAGEGIDVRPHPHINLATVTYMFEGQLLHRDSIGSVQILQPGDINLMVAGKGIVHSERTPPETRKSAHSLHALQLWLALPEADEESDPAFYHYPAEELPTTEIGGVSLRVMMGSAYGLSSPVKTFAETLYVEANLKAGQRLTLPMCEERAIYLAKGEVSSNGSVVEEFTMAILSQEGEFTVEATSDARLAFIGGEKLSERFIDWNFVSSNKERIKQAREDWKAGRFGKVSEDDEEFIPLP